jgi:exopolysaccharide production protein ExoF
MTALKGEADLPRQRVLRFLLLLMALLVPRDAPAGEYRLGPRDKLQIKVHEWRPHRGEVYEWSALRGEFIVSAAGTLSLPLIGEVPAAGLSTVDLASAISDRLQTRVGLVERPDTSVEVISYRPFYILGSVAQPGEYPYRPGLNVLQAVSIAGGLFRPADPNLLRIDRESITNRGNWLVHAMELNGLLARRARLQAELANRSTTDFPAELQAQKRDVRISQMMREEQQILEARADATKTQTAALEQLKELLSKEIVSLSSRVELKNRQLELIRKELRGVGSLVSRGLAVAPKQLSLERSEADIEGARLEIESNILKAREELSRTERTILELHGKRRNEVLAELRETQAKLEAASRLASTNRTLLEESEDFAARFQPGGANDEERRPITYVIVRGDADTFVEIAASEASPVAPGDLVKVQRPRLPSGDQPPASARLGKLEDAQTATPSPISGRPN